MSRRALQPPVTLVRPLLAAAVLAAALVPLACTDGGEQGYRAEIRRTSYGIPHITADSLADLGFGEGYALAQDHFCTLADVVVRARGERSRYFGPGEGNRHLYNDITMKGLRVHERAAEELAAMDESTRGWIEGYVSGVNQVLEETGSENLAGWCAGAPWVAPITATDLVAYQRSVTTIMGNFAAMIATAAPPSDEAAPTAQAAQAAIAGSPDGTPGWDAVERALDAGLGSNGWGIGADRSASGGGMLIANPHYPWLGSNRFWEKHLTLTPGSPDGELDVYGVGLIGIPGVAIGFNRAVAWTHTVSAGKRFTAYALRLDPENPTRYRWDDGWRDMASRTVTVEVAADEGIAEREHTVWFSHQGPVVDFPGVGWSEETVLALRDANDENEESRMQWLAMDRATSLEEFQDAHAQWGGLPWVNTISATVDGRAWYIDSSSTPHLSDDALAAWKTARQTDPLTRSFWDRGIVLLDGSDSSFEWQTDPEARDPGVISYAGMPKTERTDYVFNANDSYWLNNSAALLTGYSPLTGGEGTPRTLRTRMNDTTLSDTSPDGPAGEDGKFTLDELAAAILSNRSFAAILLRDQLVERCRADGGALDLDEACEVLANWDGRYDLDSRGAVLFREWITRYEVGDTLDEGPLFAVPFDPADPVATPNTLAAGPLALDNLAAAVQVLEDQGIALDAPLGDLQYAMRGGERIPIHGGDGTFEGIENFVRNHRNGTTLEPQSDPVAIEESRFLTPEGYPVNSGTSFIMALDFGDGTSPRAQAFLTYGESGDPDSEHFNDQTRLFSQKAWRPILFEAEDIAADLQSEVTVKSTEGSR